MTTIKDPGSHQAPERAPEGYASRSAAHTAMGVLRLVIGWTFLWAFFDKLLALGYSTGKDPVTGNVDRFGDAAWIHGGSPTEGSSALRPTARSRASTTTSQETRGRTGRSCSVWLPSASR